MSRDTMKITISCACGKTETVTAKDTGYGAGPDKWSDLSTPTSFNVIQKERTSISEMPDFESAECKKCGNKATISTGF